MAKYIMLKIPKLSNNPVILMLTEDVETKANAGEVMNTQVTNGIMNRKQVPKKISNHLVDKNH